MIRRYSHPQMDRIWSEDRRFETWLRVETAAAEAMADAGIVPAEAARDIRERGGVRHRPHRRDRADDAARPHRLHDGGGRTRRALGALAALRADLVGRRRHRPRPADGRGVRPHPREPRRPGAGDPPACVRAPRDADDRAHPRRPRRADDVRPQARPLVRGGAARHRPDRGGTGDRARGQDLRRGRHLRAPRPRHRGRASARRSAWRRRRCRRRSSSATVTRR